MADVVIGCKLPHGLVLELVEPGPLMQPQAPGRRVVLKGANSLPRAAHGFLSTPPAWPEFPYALTIVDKGFWDAWYARNKDLEIVRGGQIFVADDVKAAKAMAKERVHDVKTGLEPLKFSSDGKPSGDKRLSTEADESSLSKMRENEQELPEAAVTGRSE
jgi:hypothetical protein